MFADAGYMLGCSTENLDFGVTRIDNNFTYENFEVIVNKEIVEGILLDTGEDIFEGKLETIISQETANDEVSVKYVLNKLNDISFKVFMCHITDAFARDLVIGKSLKVKRGINYYE